MPPLLKTLDLLHSLNIFAMIFAFLCMFKWAYPWFWRGQKFNATKFDVLTLYFLLAPLVVVSKLSYQYRDMTESWLSRFFGLSKLNRDLATIILSWDDSEDGFFFSNFSLFFLAHNVLNRQEVERWVRYLIFSHNFVFNVHIGMNLIFIFKKFWF